MAPGDLAFADSFSIPPGIGEIGERSSFDIRTIGTVFSMLMFVGMLVSDCLISAHFIFFTSNTLSESCECREFSMKDIVLPYCLGDC